MDTLRACLTCLIASIVLIGCNTEDASKEVLRIDQAAIRFGTEEQIGGIHAAGESGQRLERLLPDTWSIEERSRFKEAEYSATVHLAEAPREPWAVYLPRVDTNATVSINDRPLVMQGRMKSPVARMRHYPMLRPVPADVLRAGENRIEVRLSVEASSSGSLSRIYLGPIERLQPAQDWREFFQISVVQLAALAALILFAVVKALYPRRGRGHAHYWFRAAIFFWLIYACEVWVRDAPLPVRLWEAVANGGLGLSVWSIMLGFHRAYDTPKPRIEFVSLALIVGTIVVLCVIPAAYVWPARALIGIGLCILAGYIVSFVMSSSQGSEWVPGTPQMMGGLVGVLFGAHDIVSAFLGAPLAGMWLNPYVGSLAVVAMLGAILMQLFRSMGEARDLKSHLEARVREHELELEHRYERLSRLDRERVLEHERTRMTKGLHDGIGAMLVSMVSHVESGSVDGRRLADEIRDALDDLRLVMDSLRPERELIDMLARLRSRLAARLERRGVQMKWQVRDVPQFRHFAPEHALAVLRVLKDAIDALDRVTGVRTIAVSTGTEVRERIDGVFVEISHDGDSALATARTAGPPEHLGSLNSVLAASWNATGSALRIWLPLELPRVEPS